jgi:hypothetical protein
MELKKSKIILYHLHYQHMKKILIFLLLIFSFSFLFTQASYSQAELKEATDWMYEN